MSNRLTLASTIVGALSIILAFAYSQSPQLSPTGADIGPRHYTVDKPECVVDNKGTPAPTSRTGLASPDSVVNRAINCPDQFAWMQWARINKASAGEHPAWIYWATDRSTFPESPQPTECSGSTPDPTNCPSFGPLAGDPVSRDANQPVALTFNLPSKRPAPLHTPASRARAEAILDGGEIPKNLGSVTKETIHRNRASFDYIVDNKLWYQEGLADQFDANFQVDFPAASVEIKTNWLNLTRLGKVNDLQGEYYTVLTENDSTWALVAMHITTKDLPQWFWATFEHVSNPGRCDYIGCHDSYGQMPANVEPHAVRDSMYTPDTLRSYLTETMLAGIPDVLRDNYRLKGSQTQYTLPTGEATLLGNSVTEHGFVQTSSCMTCHARASSDWQGQTPYFFGGTPIGQSFNGAPDPDWFFGTQNQTQTFLNPTDFVWSISRARPIGGGCSGADQAEGKPGCSD